MIITFDTGPEKMLVFAAGLDPHSGAASPKVAIENRNPLYRGLIQYYREIAAERIIQQKLSSARFSYLLQPLTGSRRNEQRTLS